MSLLESSLRKAWISRVNNVLEVRTDTEANLAFSKIISAKVSRDL